MAADFSRETAKIEEVYVRQVFAGGNQKYLRLPFNLITHDDGNQYFEPLNFSTGPYTYAELNTPATDGVFRIEDTAPGAGVTEIR